MAHPAPDVTASRSATTRGPAGRGWLTAGGAMSVLNGVLHGLLPVYFPWSEQAEGMYEPLRWALFATTWFLGGLLVLGGVLTIVVARATDVPRRVSATVIGGMTAFWCLAGVYELVVPFPAPVASWLLPTLSALVGGVHLVGLHRRWRAVRDRGP
jgi:hypothetical protein